MTRINPNDMTIIMENWRRLVAESDYDKQKELLSEGVSDFVFKKMQELLNKIIKGLQETQSYGEQIKFFKTVGGLESLFATMEKTSQEIKSIQIGTDAAIQSPQQVKENLIREFKNIEKYIIKINKKKNHSLKSKFIIENKKDIDESVVGTALAVAHAGPFWIAVAAIPFFIILLGKLIKFLGFKNAGDKVIMFGEKIEILERTLVEAVTLPLTYPIVSSLLKGLKTKSKISTLLIPDTIQPYWENESVQDLTSEEWIGSKMNEGLADTIKGVVRGGLNRYNKTVHDAEHHLKGHGVEAIDPNIFKNIMTSKDPKVKKQLIKDTEYFLSKLGKEGVIQPTDTDSVLKIYNHIKNYAKKNQRAAKQNLQWAEIFEEQVSKNVYYIKLKTQSSPDESQSKIRQNSIQTLRNGISHIVALFGVMVVGYAAGGHIIDTLKNIFSSLQSSKQIAQTIASHGEQVKDAVENAANAVQNVSLPNIFANIIHGGEAANDTTRLATTAGGVFNATRG